jgi:hypothetical protein
MFLTREFCVLFGISLDGQVEGIFFLMLVLNLIHCPSLGTVDLQVSMVVPEIEDHFYFQLCPEGLSLRYFCCLSIDIPSQKITMLSSVNTLRIGS